MPGNRRVTMYLPRVTRVVEMGPYRPNSRHLHWFSLFWRPVCAWGGQETPFLGELALRRWARRTGPDRRDSIQHSVRAMTPRARLNDDLRSRLVGVATGIEVDRPAGDATLPPTLFDSLDGQKIERNGTPQTHSIRRSLRFTRILEPSSGLLQNEEQGQQPSGGALHWCPAAGRRPARA